jgi:hypothetical protein
VTPQEFLEQAIAEQLLAGGIPVGEDPIFPMSQDEFSDFVKGRLDQKYGPMKKPATPRPPSSGPSLFPIRRAGLEISPEAAEAMATIEYFGRGRTPGINPAAVQQAISTGAQDILYRNI